MRGEKKRKSRDQALTNRELSWLKFNKRVQMQADNPENPLLERAKFLAIVTSNLDEFIQVRYGAIHAAALRRGQGIKECAERPAKGLYRRVNRAVLRQQNFQYLLFEGIRSELYLQGIQLYPIFTLTDAMRERETEIFKTEIKDSLRQLTAEEEPQQKQLHLFVKLVHPQRKTVRFVTVALPSALPRMYELSPDPAQHRLIRIEDIVRHHLHQLFSKEQVEQAAIFRVLRNQDFPIEDYAQEDIPQAVREMLRVRRIAPVLRLEAEERMSEEMLQLLMNRFGLAPKQKYRVTGPLDLNKLMMNLYGEIHRADLKFTPVEPLLLQELMGEDVFGRIAQKDHLLYHPYHSFAPVVHWLEHAAQDPAVREIKQTLYRVSGNSPIVQALAQACENGKQVTVLMEAMARFDEENNLFWGERLRQAGCHVIFGVPGLKTHSKITLVEREEAGELKPYLHLGTGNYHDGTAKLYTDFGLLSADPVLGEDARRFFAMLEGAQCSPLQELIKAPEELKTTLLHLIEREKEHALEGRPAGITAKMNSLLEESVIAALYSASNAGVPIRLIVRGICSLSPGREGLSENIRVVSLVGRHLEHARAFCFENGGESETYLSSADWMPRNLQKRVELMFPVKDPECKRAVENILELQWQDTENASEQQPTGDYLPKASPREEKVNSQNRLLYHLQEVLRGDSRPVPRNEEKDYVELESVGS